MPNKTINVTTLCPFYINEDDRSITCEGIIGDRLKTQFKTRSDKIIQQTKFCTTYGYCACPICKAIEKNKYKPKGS